MKETKKAASKATAKSEAAKTVAKVESAVKSAAEKAAPVAKAAEKKVASAAKAAVKKTTAKKDAGMEKITLQFGGKSYTTEELVKIAKDVWKFDLDRKESEFETVELFVKPEENTVYYVINGEIKGNFAI